uniref:Activin types I and II receptor domain-containing protein n=2 Tax=Parascaris univalens TaxID=6257 RepID=A0A915C4X1_PARUN
VSCPPVPRNDDTPCCCRFVIFSLNHPDIFQIAIPFFASTPDRLFRAILGLRTPCLRRFLSKEDAKRFRCATIQQRRLSCIMRLTCSCMVFGFILLVIQRGVAILCFDCHSDQGTCNDGECEGAVCIKMETSNRDNERRTVQKWCGEELEESGCQQSGFGSKWTSRCVCERALCNGDAALVAAGLEPSSGTVPTSLPVTHLALLSFVLFFVAASCSLLLINTLCVHCC